MRPLPFLMNGVSASLGEWEEILWRFDCCVDETEVWEIARSYDEFPHFGNIYQSLIFDHLESLFFKLTEQDDSDESIDIQKCVNDFVSYFNINGETINDVDEFLAKVEEIKAIH